MELQDVVVQKDRNESADAVLDRMWDVAFAKGLNESMPKFDGKKVYSSNKRRIDNRGEWEIPAETNLDGTPILGLRPQKVNNVGVVNSPVVQVHEKYQLDISFDGQNWQTHVFTYGVSYLWIEGPDGVSRQMPQVTEKVIIGINQSHRGELWVPGRNKKLIQWLDFHPKNEASPCWWTPEQMAEVGLWIRPVNAVQHSCNFKSEYKAVQQRKKTKDMLEGHRAMRLAMQVTDLQLIEGAAKVFGINFPNVSDDDKFDTYSAIFVEWAKSNPEKALQYILGQLPAIRKAVEKALAIGVLTVQDGTVIDWKEQSLPWMQVGSDVTEGIVQSIVKKGNLEWYNEFTGQLGSKPKKVVVEQGGISPEDKAKIESYISNGKISENKMRWLNSRGEKIVGYSIAHSNSYEAKLQALLDHAEEIGMDAFIKKVI